MDHIGSNGVLNVPMCVVFLLATCLCVLLQGCIFCGAKMCTEVVGPRVCCKDHQH